MPVFLGIDTSNYTTSAALLDSENGAMLQRKKLLPVKAGELGLRQSDAVFAHVKQLGSVTDELFAGNKYGISAVGVSSRPRDAEGSYMPCFMVGEAAAKVTASALGVPLYRFSHQAGHIAAALFSADKLDLAEDRFIAFHLSGGTTEGLLVEPDENCILRCTQITGSLDLKAGQAVDRVGGMLGLGFPAGRELERLALQSTKKFNVKPTMKDGCCCLSGVENRCKKLLEDGEAPCDIAARALAELEAALAGMTEAALARCGRLPLVYAGGVMSNSIIRKHIEERFGGIFAQPEFSADNAAGTAVLASIKHTR